MFQQCCSATLLLVLGILFVFILGFLGFWVFWFLVFGVQGFLLSGFSFRVWFCSFGADFDLLCGLCIAAGTWVLTTSVGLV